MTKVTHLKEIEPRVVNKIVKIKWLPFGRKLIAQDLNGALKFLSLALMLTVSLTFATNEEAKASPITLEETISIVDSEMVILTSSIEKIEIATIDAELVWEFPVYWENDYDSGSFLMSGNGSMSDIIEALLDIFFP